MTSHPPGRQTSLKRERWLDHFNIHTAAIVGNQSYHVFWRERHTDPIISWKDDLQEKRNLPPTTPDQCSLEQE
ncbi:hypothetical protein EYF80_038586 [Liparis tanakae]|uniref:Uncharacterized protein n=1 Tax=Liparis tanakae TaxID=230148 RepID=A0A4Z2GEW1_9TELE|nr:hypothetical protein EYF80_038586 [Liparis tanakae]